MAGFITQKVGMTRYVDEQGKVYPVTLLKILPAKVIQVKSKEEKDNVNGVVLHAGNVIKQFPLSGEDAFALGDLVTIEQFPEVSEVRLTSISKGKGFQGVVKRYNFRGGRATHGGKYRKAPGSIGTRKPKRTKKGQRLPGRMGFDTITIKSKVHDVDTTLGVIAISGAVPGATNSTVFLTV